MADIPDTELAELRRKAHSFDSDQGRLQKAQQELDAERAKTAGLEQRLAAIPATSTPHGIDPRAIEVFGQDGVTMLQGMMAPVLGKLDTLNRQLEERNNAEAQQGVIRKFQESLNQKLAGENLPGFTARLYGGDLAPAWQKFAESHPAIRAAQSAGDVETVSDMVTIFIHQNKELVAGQGFSPSPVPGFQPAVKADYNDDDYMRDMAALQSKLDNLEITEDEFTKQSNAVYNRYVAAQQKAEQAARGFGLP